MKKIIFILPFLFLLGCGEDTFNKVYKLGNLRVIAITAGKLGNLSQAEFDAGDTAVITAYVSDVGGGETVTAQIESCTDPGVAYGKTPSCAGVADRNTTYANVTVNSSTLTGKTGAMPTFNVTIPATIYTGRSSVEQFNGVDYLVTINFSVPRGHNVKAFKRLRATTRATKNQNPSLGNIVFNGGNFTNYPSIEGLFSLSSYSSEESYEYQSADGTINYVLEDMNVAWFVSDGDINYSVTAKTGETKFSPPSAPTNDLVVVAVLRDGRGGMAVTVKAVP